MASDSSKAALFDFDGVIVDSEPLGMAVADRTLRRAGFVPDQQTLLSFVGVPDRAFYERVVAEQCLHLDATDLLAKHEAEYDGSLDGVAPVPGALDLIDALKRSAGEWQLAIVSGSTRRQVEYLLERLRIRDAFDVVVTVEEVTRGKPDPEGYRLATRRLNVPSRRCVAIEDSQAGVNAAVAADLACIGLRHSAGQDLKAAHLVVESLAELTMATLDSLAGR